MKERGQICRNVSLLWVGGPENPSQNFLAISLHFEHYCYQGRPLGRANAGPFWEHSGRYWFFGRSCMLLGRNVHWYCSWVDFSDVQSYQLAHYLMTARNCLCATCGGHATFELEYLTSDLVNQEAVWLLDL